MTLTFLSDCRGPEGEREVEILSHRTNQAKMRQETEFY